MTCIVGIEHAGKVLIAGDSAGVDSGFGKHVRADEKVFACGEFVFGFAGSFRMGDLLRYKLSPPAFVENVTLNQYMATLFIDAVRQVLKDGGHTKMRDGQESGGFFLVGVRGTLYYVQSDFQVGRTVDGYQAIGCGDDLALGALFATADSKITPRARAETALNAAAYFSAAVSAPYNFVEAP